MKVYFDNSATTKPRDEVIQSMVEVLTNHYGNPSSLHGLGSEAELLMRRSRELIAKYFEVDAKEIIFTSGGTESNNLALKGVAWYYENRGKHIITTEIEHASVYSVCEELEAKFGFEVTYLPVNAAGIVEIDDLKKALRDDTILVSVMHVNNEMGAIQPLQEIGELLKQYPKILFHVDAVQGVGKAPLLLKDYHIDLLSVSGHKLHAPKGTGFLYVRDGVHLYPLYHGGAQQNKLRPGTENVAGSVALAKAIRLLKEQEEQDIAYMHSLKKQTLEGLHEIQGVRYNSSLDLELSAPHILNISFLGLKPEVIVHALEEKGIYVSTKSACSSKVSKPSRILKAMGLKDKEALGSIRISFSPFNTKEEVDYFLQAIHEIIPYHQKIMRV